MFFVRFPWKPVLGSDAFLRGERVPACSFGCLVGFYCSSLHMGTMLTEPPPWWGWSALSLHLQRLCAGPMSRGIQAVPKPGRYPRSFPTRFALLRIIEQSHRNTKVGRDLWDQVQPLTHPHRAHQSVSLSHHVLICQMEAKQDILPSPKSFEDEMLQLKGQTFQEPERKRSQRHGKTTHKTALTLRAVRGLSWIYDRCCSWG